MIPSDSFGASARHVAGNNTLQYTLNDPIFFADPMPAPNSIMSRIKSAAQDVDWKKVSLRVLSFLSGLALGTLTALAIAGVLSTPVGWGIAGGALLIALIGSAYYGGPKEFLNAIRLSLAGFGVGFSASGIGTAIAAGEGPMIALRSALLAINVFLAARIIKKVQANDRPTDYLSRLMET